MNTITYTLPIPRGYRSYLGPNTLPDLSSRFLASRVPVTGYAAQKEAFLFEGPGFTLDISEILSRRNPRIIMRVNLGEHSDVDPKQIEEIVREFSIRLEPDCPKPVGEPVELGLDV